MKKFGHTWVQDEGGDYSTVIDDKFHLITWEFGGKCHQMNILFLDAPEGEGQICIDCVPTRDEAMKTMIEWVDRYKESGFLGAEELIRRSYIEYPSLYTYRHQVLDHLFFVIGNGVDWADGQLTDGVKELDPWDDDEVREREKKRDLESHARMYKSIDDILDRLEAKADTDEEKEFYAARRRKEDKTEDLYAQPRPLEDDGRPVDFYPVSNYSKVTKVPDNVADDWLLVAIEAGEMLLERQDPSSDRAAENRKRVSKAMPRLYRMRDERGLSSPEVPS